MSRVSGSALSDSDRLSNCAVIFDMDGVLVDTAELHYRSWKRLADEMGFDFGGATYDRMRGLGRAASLDIFLEACPQSLGADECARLAARKNEDYLRLVEGVTPADLLPGVGGLMEDLRGRGFKLAVGSSSRNAAPVLSRLGVEPLLDAVVDANTAPRSKPDPQVFLKAAELVGVPAGRCVVIEDAEAGVAAARAARMRVVGIGPAARVGQADVVVERVGEVTAELVEQMLGKAAVWADC